MTQQLELQQLQGIVQKSSEMGGTDAVAEGLAARLAAAQVMRREAEEKAAELGQKFAAANKQLEGLLQQRGDDAEQLESKVSIQVSSCVEAACVNSFAQCCFACIVCVTASAHANSRLKFAAGY